MLIDLDMNFKRPNKTWHSQLCLALPIEVVKFLSARLMYNDFASNFRRKYIEEPVEKTQKLYKFEKNNSTFLTFKSFFSTVAKIFSDWFRIKSAVVVSNEYHILWPKKWNKSPLDLQKYFLYLIYIFLCFKMIFFLFRLIEFELQKKA